MINLRVKELRQALQLTQTSFGERVGVAPAAISKIESGINTLTDQMIISICHEFRVSEEWLRTGAGKMFVKSDDTLFSTLSKDYHVNERDVKVIKTFLNMADGERSALINFLEQLASAVKSKKA